MRKGDMREPGPFPGATHARDTKRQQEIKKAKKWEKAVCVCVCVEYFGLSLSRMSWEKGCDKGKAP